MIIPILWRWKLKNKGLMSFQLSFFDLPWLSLTLIRLTGRFRWEHRHPKFPLREQRRWFNPHELCEELPWDHSWEHWDVRSDLTVTTALNLGDGEKTQSQISKAPRLVSSSGPVSKLSLASFSAGKGPNTCRVHSHCRRSAWLGGKPLHPGVCQRPVTGLLIHRSVVGLHLESFSRVRTRRWEERILSLLALWSASISVPVSRDLAVSSKGSLWVPQVLFILQFMLQSLGWLQHTWRSCFSARNLRQCCGGYLVAQSLASPALLSCLASSTRPTQLAALFAVFWNNLCRHLWKC